MENLIITRKKGYAIVQINRGKVNALNHATVQDIRQAIKELAADDAVRGVIISGKPHFYSAGLDVIELYGYDREKMGQFFIDFGSMYLELARFKKPLIAAITGHSPAGGAVIAVACDYRVMAEGAKYTIGLNEVAVNILISEDIIRAYSFWLGQGKATKYLLEGKLLKVQEAYEAGLLDEVCPLEEVVARAEKQMKRYLQADDYIWRTTKAKCRKDWLDKLSSDSETALKETEATWWRPEIRARMKFFVDMLMMKKQRKS